LARHFKIKRFLQVSTDEVYGSRCKGKFSETDHLNPSSPYSASKAAADLIASSFFKTHNLPVIITRSCNNFGPFQFPEKIIPLFITNIIEGKTLPIYARGENIRDWIFVEDNCRAIDLILHKGRLGGIYNISAQDSINNINLARLILREMGQDRVLIRFVKDRPAHDFRYAINSSKLKRLGFKSRTSFRKNLGLTIKWYLDNSLWWKQLKRS